LNATFRNPVREGPHFGAVTVGRFRSLTFELGEFAIVGMLAFMVTFDGADRLTPRT
jgi:hypothetical protein